MERKYVCEDSKCDYEATREEEHKEHGKLIGFICPKCGWHCKLKESDE